MPIPILQTKLYIPPLRHALVPRPQLIARLNQGAHHKLTLVAAPAGFGKTTLVIEWLDQRNAPAAWLSLDEGDNDPTRFLSYVIAALQQVDAAVGQSAHALLQSPQPLTAEAVMTALINDLTRVASPATLILDDYHLISSRPVHDALTFLLDHLPPQLRLVLTTRADPPLPLARLRARGELHEIRADDLRFNTAEATVLLNDVNDLQLAAAEVTALTSRTEGWIAGLQLAGLSLLQQPDRAHFIRAFAGDNHYIVDYLVEEVLNQQSDELQAFLLQTSILGRMNALLCNAVTEQTDSQARLEQLARANLFMTALDDQRQWYRYHRLFAEVLRNRLKRTQPAAIPNLYRRAADWCERNGWTAEAIAHSLNAADHTQAARLIDQNARTMLKQGQATTLLEWLNKLPAAAQAAVPQLCVAKAWARLLVGPLDVFAAALQSAESAAAAGELTDAGQRALTAEVQAMRVIATVEQGDTSAAVVQLAQQALRDLPADSPYLQSALATALALAHRANGDVQAAFATFTQTQTIAEQNHDLFSQLLISYELAELQLEQGQLRQAEARHRQSIQLANEHFGPGARHIPLTGAAQIGLGKVLYEWNELEAARQHLEQGHAIADQPGGIGFPRTAAVALAHLHQALGDEDAATAWMTRATAMARSAPRPQVAIEIELHHVRLLLRQGQIDGATAWLRVHGLDMTQVPDYSGEAHYLTLLRVHLARHERTALLAARAVISALLQRAQTQQRGGRIIELYTLQALLLQALGQTEEALRPLAYALAAAEPAGYLRSFLDEGQAMFELLQLALARKIKTGYVSRILAAGKVEQERLAAQQSAQPLVEPLTARELEILTLIAGGLSNRALAETLVITIGTVKRHVMNIYGKLGVNSRTQAIAKARELRLID